MYPEPPPTSSGSSISTLKPYEVINNAEKTRDVKSSCQAKGDGSSVYIELIPLEQNYESIATEFGEFGVKNKLGRPESHIPTRKMPLSL